MGAATQASRLPGAIFGTAAELTVSFSTKPSTAGSLTAIVTTSGKSSGTAVQVASITPVVTSSTAGLAADATTLTINGFGFDPIASRNTVVLNNGAVGTVTSATTTTLTVTFSTQPATAGSITAIVTTNSLNSGTAVQAATITPVVTSSESELAANAATMIIDGFGFDPTAANNLVTLSNGAIGTVTSASTTSLTVTFSTRPAKADVLTAIVTTNSQTSGSAVQVASVVPVVLANSGNILPITATTLTIVGYGFDTTIANNTVVFNNGAVGAVTAATATTLTVTLSVRPTTVGGLSALVTTNALTSGSFTPIGTVRPVITVRTTGLAANASSITIVGVGFNPTASLNTVTFINGAVGTVTAATTTSLTVALTTKPTKSGRLTASVTTSGVSSGVAVQVANVLPVLTSNSAALAGNATSLVIAGFGFDLVPSKNIVTFSSGAVGVVSAATATSLTVTLTTPPTAAGILTASIQSNSINGSSGVQVASIFPGVITNSSLQLAANASSITINGFGFDPIANRNTVVLNNGAVGTVSAATTSSLTITLSTRPATAGPLTAIVTTNSISSGAAIQVAAAIPTVTSSTTNVSASAGSVIINGFGFDSTADNNTVVFNNGAVGTVTSATSTTLTVTLSTNPTSAGSLTAVVTTNSASSGAAVQVATVVPVVTSETAGLGINSTTITINGFGFSPTAAQNVVVFNNGAVGTVTAATPTALTVTFSTRPTALGNLTAIVTTSTRGSGSPIQVATVIPVVTLNATIAPIDAATIIITGAGFSAVAANNTVVFSNGAVGTVTTATATSLTVTYSTKPTSVGDMTAVVTTSGFSSGTPIQTATVRPVVTLNTANLGANSLTVFINGFGFDTTAANNTVVFSNGAEGTVTSATATRLTVTLSVRASVVGVLTAVVTTNDISSGAAIQVARVIPFITSSAVKLSANANMMTIRGFGFSATAASNLLVFNNGAVGTVTTVSSPTVTGSRSLTVTFSVKPAAAGSLTAVVTTSTIANAGAVQVATVIPIVTSSTTSIGANATTVTINGFGFDATASRNTVVFSNGAVGTVTLATRTALTVTFSTKPTSVGKMTAIVTTNSVSSVAAIQVATVAPAVVASTANLVAGGTSITITGFGFDSAAYNNSVVFNNGAIGVVTAATSTTLSVSFATLPNQAGPLTAVVITNGISSGTAIQVATAIPVVTASTTNISASTTTFTITGSHFSPTPGNNTVVFDNGAIGTVTASTLSSLTVSFSVRPRTAGNLTAIVTTNGVASGTAVQVATVTPTVTSSTISLGVNAVSVVINGFGFSATAAQNTVVLNNGAVGTVTAATVNALTVTFSVKPIALGSLAAIVTTNSLTSGAAVQVATVAPVVTIATTPLLANANTVVIMGFGFSTTAANNTVVFDNGAVGIVSAATATSLTVTLTTMPTSAGPLTAVVTTDGASSGAAIQVARVAPVVTSSTVDLAATANTITINGFGFSPIANKNTVVFSNGAVGTVTASTATTLTVTFSVKPRTAGPMTVVVTSNLVTSGAAVNVATITPVVTSSVANLLITATTMTIRGFGFDPIASRNTVVFSNGAVGTVTAATATTLTISFTTRPLTLGVLTAIVTTNLKSSGLAVQVASVI